MLRYLKALIFMGEVLNFTKFLFILHYSYKQFYELYGKYGKGHGENLEYEYWFTLPQVQLLPTFAFKDTNLCLGNR